MKQAVTATHRRRSWKRLGVCDEVDETDEPGFGWIRAEEASTPDSKCVDDSRTCGLSFRGRLPRYHPRQAGPPFAHVWDLRQLRVAGPAHVEHSSHP